MRSILLFAILIFSVPVFGASDEALSNIAGVYKGSLLSNGDMLPVTTHFNRTDQGELTGTYELTEEDGLEVGKLKNINVRDDFFATMTWEDKYGEGTLIILFSEDYLRFKGFWGDNGNPIALDWDGVKQ